MADIVLVHGLWYRSWSMHLLRKRLHAAGQRVFCFSYPTMIRPHTVNATHLAEFCRKNCTQEFHLVGHSLGGLVILHMLAAHPEIRPDRVVLLGTPLKGSQVAQRLSGLPVARLLLGQAAASLASGASAVPAGLSLGVIAGTSGWGLGRMVSQLDKPNDGTVAVAETVTGSVSDHVQIPVSHTGMLFSRETAEQVANFIARGVFRHN